MLKATAPKTLVEASSDKLWGTGIPMNDTHALDTSRWHGVGWMSNILGTIHEEALT